MIQTTDRLEQLSSQGSPFWPRCKDLLFPSLEIRFPIRMGFFVLRESQSDSIADFFDQRELFRRVDPGSGLEGVVEKSEHAVVFVMGDRIELVGMALRALEGHPQDSFSDAIDPIEHFDHAELLRHDSTFFVDHAIAQKACRDDLFLGRVREKIAGDLFDDELIVGHILGYCIEYPVSPSPLVALQVLFVAVGIRVSSHIEPWSRPFLGKAIIGQEFLNRSGKAFGLKRFDLLWGWRYSDQIQIDTTAQLPGLGLGCTWPTFFVERVGHEPINRMIDLATVYGLAQVNLASRGWDKGPVFVVLSTLVDPALEQFDLFFAQRLLQAWGRHHMVGIIR